MKLAASFTVAEPGCKLIVMSLLFYSNELATRCTCK